MTLDDDLDEVLIGEPTKAMAAAKRIVQHRSGSTTIFITIATGKMLATWTRIAAIWILGFTDTEATSVRVLERISHDPREEAKIRDYANEALCHIRYSTPMFDH